MSNTQRYDVYDGEGLIDFANTMWMLSLEKPEGVTSITEPRLDYANPIAQWQGFDAVPELLRRKIATVMVLGLDDAYTDDHDHTWGYHGFTLNLTDDEINSITEENDDE